MFGVSVPCLKCQKPRKTFDDFNVVRGAERALEAAKDLADGSGPPWLVLSGTFGAGKTHLALAVHGGWIQRLSQEIPARRIRYYYVPHLLDDIRSGFDDDSWRTVEKEAIGARYAIFDDLGDAGRSDSQRDVTAAGTTPWAREEVTKILSERYEARLHTMITTNHDRRDIEVLYGGRLASRIFGEATGQVRVVALTCDDYRREGS